MMKKNSSMMAENNSGHACVVSILVFLSFLTMAFAATSLFMPGVAADTGHYEFYLYESGQIEMKTDDEPFTSKNLQNVTLLYSVEGEASEVPYFIPDSLIMESGDNSAKNMAVIADVLSYWGEYLLAGVGYADAIYIIIPVHGQLYMMRGAAFSYYEFLHPSRLSDPEWYEMLKKYKIEEKRPKWYQHYIDTEKEEIPVPADPYDSGC